MKTIKKIKNIFSKQEDGNSLIINLFPIIFLFPLLMCIFFVKQTESTKEYVQDALTISDLAGARVNLKEFGKTNNLIVEDIDLSYENYKEALKGNLNLKDDYSAYNELIQGIVNIKSYIVYNVNTDTNITTVYDVIRGTTYSYPSGYSLTAPDGTPIVNTSIWSQIEFPTKTFFNTTIQVSVGELTDIAINYANLRH